MQESKTSVEASYMSVESLQKIQRIPISNRKLDEDQIEILSKRVRTSAYKSVDV